MIALIVLATWIPDADLPLGDSDDGRILGRFGLQARNFWEDGPAASGYGSSMAPYGAAINYAHHPPLMNFVQIASVGVFGQNVVSLRVLTFLLGAATVPAMAALLRSRGLAWGPTVLAVAAMAATGFFFVYMRQGGGFSLIVAATAMVAYLRDREGEVPWWGAAGAAALAAATAMQSWIAMAAMGLLILWLFAGKRLAPITWWVALGGLAGVAISAGWILNATDLSELTGQVETRTDTAAFGLGEFLSRQWEFAGRLTPGWFRWLAIPALIAGLVDKRTRVPTAITLGVAAAWTFGLQEGAWVHVLWNLPWVAPVTIGLAVIFDTVRQRLPSSARPLAAAVAGLVVLVSWWGLLSGPTRDTFLADPARAGEIFAERQPEAGTTWVWITPGVSTARWISYYWDLPVRTLQEQNLTDLGPSDFVLVNIDRIPDYVPDVAFEQAVEINGRYALLPAAVVQP